MGHLEPWLDILGQRTVCGDRDERGVGRLPRAGLLADERITHPIDAVGRVWWPHVRRDPTIRGGRGERGPGPAAPRRRRGGRGAGFESTEPAPDPLTDHLAPLDRTGVRYKRGDHRDCCGLVRERKPSENAGSKGGSHRLISLVNHSAHRNFPRRSVGCQVPP